MTSKCTVTALHSRARDAQACGVPTKYGQHCDGFGAFEVTGRDITPIRACTQHLEVAITSSITPYDPAKPAR